MTVSSTSETMPNVTPSSTTNTDASTSSPAMLSDTVVQPAASFAGIASSSTPPRSDRMEVRVPSTMTSTGAPLTGMLTKLRQPRKLAARSVRDVPGLRSTTRPSTRTQPVVP